MRNDLTDAIIKKLPVPKKGLVIVRDKEVRGLGVRILPSGTRSYVLDYHASGRRRIYTIGRTSDWSLKAAREHAKKLKFRIRNDGEDPAQQLKADRDAETVKDLCDVFLQDYVPKLRPSTRRDYTRLIEKDIVPAIGTLKVDAVKNADIQKLHSAITKRGSSVVANGCVILVKRLFNVAKVRELTTGANPATGVALNPTSPRERFLSDAEIAGLTKALEAYDDQDVADIFRLLMLTGARRGEAQAATWDQMDLSPSAGVWTKPSSHTKQKKTHRVPLASPAQALLTKRAQKRDATIKELNKELAKAKGEGREALEERTRRLETFVFPASTGERGHISEIKKAWASLCKTAKIKGARIHDLRHTAASVLASKGVSLIMIGEMLGHTQTSTTKRYAHLVDEARRATADLLGAAISKAGKGK